MTYPKMTLVLPTTEWPGAAMCQSSWSTFGSCHSDSIIVKNRPMMEAYQLGLEATDAPILGFVHDDVMVSEYGWDKRVLEQFSDPQVGLVGFGGSAAHGHPEMYHREYEINLMGRGHFLSNMREAEIHGSRFQGECDVAVLDGFTFFVRREILMKAGGWRALYDTPCAYWCYDYWLCCETRRQGYRIRLVGVACDHLGTRGSNYVTGKPNSSGPWEDGLAANRWIYDHYRDVLPFVAGKK